MSDGRRARGQRTRAALIGATLDMIVSEGAEAVTQRKVARAAGTSLASTTYHFPAAADLLVAAFEESARLSAATFRRLAAQVAAGDIDLIDAAMAFAGREAGDASSAADAIPQLFLAAARRPELRPTAEAFLAQMAAGFTPFLDAPDAGLTVARALTGLILHEMQRGDERASKALRDDVARLFDAFGLTDGIHHALHTQQSVTKQGERSS